MSGRKRFMGSCVNGVTARLGIGKTVDERPVGLIAATLVNPRQRRRSDQTEKVFCRVRVRRYARRRHSGSGLFHLD
jgi:hypothetical protein